MLPFFLLTVHWYFQGLFMMMRYRSKLIWSLCPCTVLKVSTSDSLSSILALFSRTKGPSSQLSTFRSNRHSIQAGYNPTIINSCKFTLTTTTSTHIIFPLPSWCNPSSYSKRIFLNNIPYAKYFVIIDSIRHPL